MTRVFEDIDDWRQERQRQVRSGLSLGFVPTMGALHDGHLSLVERSRRDNDLTLVSVFVNPMQFDEQGDFARYPRTLADDLALLREHKADYVLVPSAKQMYPDNYRYRVGETELSKVMEGAHRHGHFDGVLTVVLKLLQVAAAERAYFGEKDWQQLALVRGLAQAFFVPTAIVPCPTVREADGLAMSSRNRRLAGEHRGLAPAFFRVLSTASTAENASGALTALGFVVDYVEDREGRRLGAVRLGDVRLIDNVPLEDPP